jgi:transcriptional regulator with XRE-family HTH domain
MRNNPNYSEVFRERLKQARLDKGLSYERFELQIGVEHPAAYWWEKGRAYPKVCNLLKIAEVLDVSLDWLFGIEKNAI